MSDSKYFTTTKKGEIFELKSELNSDKKVMCFCNILEWVLYSRKNLPVLRSRLDLLSIYKKVKLGIFISW